MNFLLAALNVLRTRARGGLHVSQIGITDLLSFSNVPDMCFIQIGENDIRRLMCSRLSVGPSLR